MNRTRTIPHTAAAFTLVEMMVVVAILAIIMLSVNMILNNLTRAINLGVATSQVIASARSVGDHMWDDGQHMVGPREGGFLVIVNREISGVRFRPEDPNTQSVRSDLVYWIRKRGDLVPVAPGNTGSFASGQSGAPYVSVTYLHATRLDGSSSVPPDSDAVYNWSFARHALFLDGGASGPRVSGSAHGNVLAGGLYDITSVGLPDILADLAVASDHSQYRARALAYTFSSNRIQARRFPFSSDGPVSASNFSVDNVAQMHPYLAGNVGQFIVEFAADTNLDGEIDYTADGSTRWYSMDDMPTWSGQQRYNPNGGSAAQRVWVFEHGDTGPRSAWPHMLRLRYRIHDAAGRLMGPDARPGRPLEQIILVNRN